jgi:hypothetical protein
MKSIIGRIAVLAMGVLVALPMWAVTIPVRGSSRNGENSNVQFWAMFGPTQQVLLTKGTGNVFYKQQVVCPSQTVANAFSSSNHLDDGGCSDGAYLFIFQLLSGQKNITIQISGLVGFTPDANSPNYGVMLCDSAQNTLELCTTATEDQLPAVTFSTNADNTTATFVIPKIPTYPAGKSHQGRGLTLFVLTQQTASHPVSLPRLSWQ